ncbi:MAG: PilT/PilU family type 4a pilus ATPase [Clostridiaceae bacterium]|jgi:twitching motility protein PilT|nr:PilT/PilU family type 4a pilus ATPase [Clostridiaceae bacterium]
MKGKKVPLDAPIQTDKTEPRIEKLSLRGILAYALENGASDIHLKVARPPAIRIEGVLRFTEIRELAEIDMMRFLDEIMSPLQKQYFLETGDADFAASVPALGRFRVNCYRQRGTTAMVFRYVKADIWDFRTLNLPERAMERIASLDRGLVLVTGTTSSGKSTTLAALIDRINATRQSHILTLEDPIEYLHADKKCSVSQREVSIDTKDFKTGLRAIMREDPNVILIGEMRDAETFQACLGAAETGHLVFSTLHTTNVMMTIDRILDMFPADQHAQVRSQLALQLRAIVAQRLLPTADGKGRVPAVEVMFNDPGIAPLIRDGEIERIPNVIADGQDDGMQTFNMALVSLVKKQIVTQKAAEEASDNPDALKMNLQGIFGSRDRGGISRR